MHIACDIASVPALPSVVVLETTADWLSPMVSVCFLAQGFAVLLGLPHSLTRGHSRWSWPGCHFRWGCQLPLHPCVVPVLWMHPLVVPVVLVRRGVVHVVGLEVKSMLRDDEGSSLEEVATGGSCLTHHNL